MISPVIPEDEKLRLKELYEYEILDSGQDEDFDEIVRMASVICNTPISLVTLVDADRQWFKAKIGVAHNETDRNTSFCAHTILGEDVFVVPDASVDERFHDNPLVTGDPDIRFYVGVPLISPSGGKMGSLCVIDTIPREVTDHQREVLRVLGKQVVKLMELRKKNYELKIVSDLEREQRKELQRISAIQNKITSILAHDMRGPLGALKTLLDIDIPQDKFKELASGQVDVTLSLIDNIVEWGQLQLSGKISEKRKYPLRTLVQEILNSCSIPASLKEIVLVNNVEDALNISNDQYAIRFILRNLLTNSIKFTKAGHIFVYAELVNGQLRMTVKDTGVGMERTMAKQLFTGPRKMSRSGTDNETGSGVGLSLIKEFIDKNNGSIRAESEPGKGTTIIFTLHLS